MRLALLDFDDVLFNTAGFGAAARQIFIEAGADREEYDEFHQKMRDDFKIQNKTYHQKDHAELFMSRFPAANRQFLEKNLSALNKEMPRFVYEDSSAFLDALSQNGWHRIILTFGNDDWQRYKVGSSGIAEMVEDVIVTSDPTKVEAVKKVLSNLSTESAFFIDDNPCQALNSVKAEFPHVRTFQLIRPELESTHIWHEGCDHNCRSLDEAKEMLLSA